MLQQKLRQSPSHAATSVFFLISFIYADNIFPGIVFVNAVHERRASEAYKTLSIKGFRRRFFVALPFICKLPTGYFLGATLQRTEQTSFVQVDSEYPSSTMPALSVLPLQ